METLHFSKQTICQAHKSLSCTVCVHTSSMAEMAHTHTQTDAVRPLGCLAFEIVCVCVREKERWRLCQCFGVSHDGWATGTYGLLLLPSKSPFTIELFAWFPGAGFDITVLSMENEAKIT